jgi:lipopolysaccharide export system ATP-binding protein
MILKAENLVKKYKTRTVVNNVSVQVAQGEIVGLLGPNGAGKTTSFYMIVGLIKPNEGRIYLEEEDITALPMYQRAKRGLGYLAQEASVFRKLTVEENILAVLEMRDFTKQQRKDKVDQLLEEFSLQKVRKSLGMSLSGGERRRTELHAPWRWIQNLCCSMNHLLGLIRLP